MVAALRPARRSRRYSAPHEAEFADDHQQEDDAVREAYHWWAGPPDRCVTTVWKARLMMGGRLTAIVARAKA